MLNLQIIQMFLGIAAFIIFLVWKHRKEVPNVISVCVLYFFFNAVYFGYYREAVQLLLFYLFYLHLSTENARKILWACFVVLFFNLIWFCFGNRFGLMSAYSFDVAILVLLLPVMLDKVENYKAGWFIFISTLGLACYFSRTAIMAFFAMAAATYIWHKRFKELLLVPLVFAASYFMRSDLLYPSDRFDIWRTHMGIWFDHASAFFGFGLGSFAKFGPITPISKVVAYNIMHNDYLQTLYETGIVGLGLFLWFLIYLFIKTFKHSAGAFSVFCGLLVIMGTYFPLHFFLSQLVLVCFLKLIHSK